MRSHSSCWIWELTPIGDIFSARRADAEKSGKSAYEKKRPAGFQTKPRGDFEKPRQQETHDEKDVLRRALIELRTRKELPVDVKLASDVTNPRNWYHNADSVRQIMRRVCELNDTNAKLGVASKMLTPVKGKQKRLRSILESELAAAHNDKMDLESQSQTTDVVHYTYSEKVRVPTQNSDDNDTQSEMKVVITKTSYGNQQATNVPAKLGQESSSRGRLSHRLPDLPRFPHPKESCSPSVIDSPEPVKVKLPILGKSMAQRNEGEVFTRPLKGDIKRIILGLYGESFDPNSSGHYTYKKIGGNNRESRDESPVHQVAPKFDERPQQPTSKTLAMFQHKHSADIATRMVTTRRTRRTKSLKHVRTKPEKVEEPNMFPFPISNWTPREDEKHLLHKQLKLFHQQIAQENIQLLERDFLYRSLPTHPNTAAAFAHRDTSLPENVIINPRVPEDVALSPDADLTFVPFMAELEMKLKKKRDRANERRRRLDKIKEMKRIRNPHLETVYPKTRSLAQLIDEQRLARTAAKPDVLQQKVPMETKVYKIFGERSTRKQAMRLDRKLSDSSKISVISQMDMEPPDYKVKEVC